MRDVAIIAFSQLPSSRSHHDRQETELVQPVVSAALAQAGLKKNEVGFTCSGSSDYLLGRPFSFVSALDAIAPWPPISESHVEMDGAWALYEAWVKLQIGKIDTALVYAYGKSSLGDLRDVLTQQLDPYYVAPLWPDSISMAALQARVALDQGVCTERDMAEVAVRNRANGQHNEFAQLTGEFDVETLLNDPYIVSPLRKHDCAPISDGACAIVLAAGDVARAHCERPAWIRGIDHRIEPHSLGVRDLAASPSTATAAEKVGATSDKLDIAELHAPFSHQEIILKHAIGLNGETKVNPSGGALSSNPVMVAGLTRFGEAAQRISSGDADRALAHATSGPCLQQNMLCVLEAS